MSEHKTTLEPSTAEEWRAEYFRRHEDVQRWMGRALAAEADAARWKAQAFQPLGDNHHNAEMCPHCNPNGWRLAPREPTYRMAGAGAEVLTDYVGEDNDELIAVQAYRAMLEASDGR